MAPSKVRRKTLSNLGKAVKAMMTAEFDLALQGRTDEELTEAARTLLGLQRARLRLGTAALADIRDALRLNEKQLLAGIASLERSLENLNRLRRFLDSAAALLNTVGRVVPLVV